ncbi:MAG: CPBP family intramembrane metalloprotease [Deltaproteobacteria bacterium]|nr:CPBP family intramembrane metalloprotease [Deltaproteobacteria bacterium]
MEKGTRATQAFALYCFLVATYLSVGGLLQYRFGLLGISINEIFLLAMPGIVYAQLTGLSLKKTFPIRQPTFKEFLLVLVMTAVVIVPIALLVEYQNQFWPLPPTVQTFYDQLMKHEGILDAVLKFIVLALIPAVCEELFFRGLLQGMMVSSFGVTRGLLLTALFFAVAHVNPWYFIYYFFLGTYLGLLRNWRNNLALCILAHLANNLYSLYS